MKILGIGKNYDSKLEDINTSKNGTQVIFSKPESSLVLNNKNIIFPDFTSNLLYEVELVIKIGKKGKNINIEDASSYIDGIAVGIDYTAKDILTIYKDIKGPWDLAKGFDGAAPISEFKNITEFNDLNNINFSLKINDEMKQVGNTALMVYDFTEIIAYISKFMTLEKEDLIFTGTPAIGAGKTFKGDHLQAFIENDLLLDFKMI